MDPREALKTVFRACYSSKMILVLGPRLQSHGKKECELASASFLKKGELLGI
jgi:hypothetical protein